MENTTKKNVKKNYIYNVLYQLFLIIVPLVVTPAVSKALTPDGIGKYSFAFSLTTYFTIFGALGFGFYAQREIAKIQGDKERQSIVFWEINICRLIPVGLAVLIDVILLLFNVYQSYNSLMLVMLINVVALAFDISFLFQGNEDFRKLVLRNFIIKAISIVLILFFVKKPSDILIYALINSISVIVSNLSLWGYLKKYLIKIDIRKLHPLKHLKGTLILFVPTIATAIYVVLDKTLIGILVPGEYTVIENGVEVVKKYADLENGYYEQSEKLVKVAMTVITCIGTVMIPRNSNEIACGNFNKVYDNVHTSIRLVLLLGIPMMFGIASISSSIVPWFLGEGYEPCVYLMMILSPLIIIIGLSNVFGLQYLLPMGNDKKFSIALFTGAFVNLGLNIIIIPFLKSYGAAIATIAAEAVVTVVMWFMVRKNIHVIRSILASWRYIIAGIAMFIALWFIKGFFGTSILDTLILVTIGALIYGAFILALVDPLVYGLLKNILKKLYIIKEK